MERQETAPTFDAAEARQFAADALKACLAGDEDRAVALYRRCVLPEVGAKLGLVLHLRMLENAGRMQVARWLRARMFAKGNDIALAAASPDMPAGQIAAEYEGFFARGIGNTAMITGYIAALGRLGAEDRVAQFFASDLLLQQCRIGDAAAVADALLEAEPTLEHGHYTITHETSYLHGFERRGQAVYDALMAEIREAVAEYLAHWAASDHILAPLVPRDFTIKSWAMIARAGGHNRHHIHPYGWATSVYYPLGLPAAREGGELRIGGWQNPPPPGWPDMVITPEPGLLVIMPSWYVHWTEPMGVDAPRIAIATDIVAPLPEALVT